MKWLLFAILFLFPIFSYGSGAPMSCTEFSTSANYTFSAGGTTYLEYYTAKLGMFKNETSSYIKVSDLTGFDSSHEGGILSGYCLNIDNGIANQCSNNYTQNDIVLVAYNSNETHNIIFDLQFHYEARETLFTFFDDGTISEVSGILYSPEHPCSYNTAFNATTCCTSFVSAPEVYGNFPRCKYFKSRTNVHSREDYIILATLSMNYFLIDNIIFLKGNFSGTNDSWFFINDQLFELSYSLNGTVFLPRGDVKFFFSTSFINYGDRSQEGKPAKDSIKGLYDVPNVRLFLIRNGLTLMKEGVPYTKDNDCQYFSIKDNEQKMPVSIEVCCKEFE